MKLENILKMRNLKKNIKKEQNIKIKLKKMDLKNFSTILMMKKIVKMTNQNINMFIQYILIILTNLF